MRALVGGARGALGVHSIGRRAEAYEALEIESESRGERDERDLVRDALTRVRVSTVNASRFRPLSRRTSSRRT